MSNLKMIVRKNMLSETLFLRFRRGCTQGVATVGKNA